MKKIVVMLFSAILVLSTGNLISAETAKPKVIVTPKGNKVKVKKEIYATTEDILLRLMEPKVNKIITDKYGKQMSWRIEKIRDVALIADHIKKDSEVWYDMKMFVKVNEAEKSDFQSYDDIEVRIDIPNMFTHDRYKNTNSDMKVTLLKYEQMK
ncbi:DUF3888 domain-containing protein [Bacillus salipaludis]|uniref:DUF3888 domain-containing protein n=1 Tax=Bacillus salipaludis TaxID=2547811 RepID=A0A4R5VK88_9BACI|nr:DUF3888 domain-containing protein [Bacillus salipaludis]TDK58170.1 DUF3888 domain-containing protein [Bacillus salipaludis]